MLKYKKIGEMKRLKAASYLFLTMTIGYLLTGCEALEDLVRFNYTDQVSFTLPPTTPGIFPVVNTPEVQSSGKQSFEQNNTQAKYVKTAYLTDLVLTIQKPDNKNFTFLKSIEIFIDANGEEKQLIASKYDIDNSVGNILALDTEASVNLKPYIVADGYSIEVKAVSDETTNQEIEITSDMTFSVTADVF